MVTSRTHLDNSQTQIVIKNGGILELKTSKPDPTAREIKTQLDSQYPAYSNVSEDDIKIRRKFTG